VVLYLRITAYLSGFFPVEISTAILYHHCVSFFFSIICAQYLCNLKLESSVKAIRIAQIFVGSVMVFLILVIHYFFRPGNITFLTGLLLLLTVVLFTIVTYSTVNGRFKIFYQVCTVVFFVNLYFNLAYYPKLLTYQADSEAAFWINNHNPENLAVVQSRIGFGFALDFIPMHRSIT